MWPKWRAILKPIPLNTLPDVGSTSSSLMFRGFCRRVCSCRSPRHFRCRTRASGFLVRWIEVTKCADKLRGNLRECHNCVNIELRCQLVRGDVATDILLKAPAEFRHVFLLHRQPDGIGVSGRSFSSRSRTLSGLCRHQACTDRDEPVASPLANVSTTTGLYTARSDAMQRYL